MVWIHHIYMISLMSTLLLLVCLRCTKIQIKIQRWILLQSLLQIWNYFPLDIQSSEIFEAFTSLIRTRFFSLAFDWGRVWSLIRADVFYYLFCCVFLCFIFSFVFLMTQALDQIVKLFGQLLLLLRCYVNELTLITFAPIFLKSFLPKNISRRLCSWSCCRYFVSFFLIFL